EFSRMYFSTVQMSLRGGFLLFPTKQSPVLKDVSVVKGIAYHFVAHVAAKVQERRLATTSIYRMYGRELC
ncbi:MAG: hypothetical protein Q8L87_11585, partial [Anaerolineales bacterium]|nr:hypothetical protein [Anaerolineales bacterium]